MNKVNKIILLFIFFIFALFIGELILRNENTNYQSWLQRRAWHSRLKEYNKINHIELKGHWHLSRIDPKERSLIDELPTIDFENDSIAILGKHQRHGGIGGYHDSKNKTIRFGGECFTANFSYTIEDGKLNLTQTNYQNELDFFSAKKCNKNCCNKQEDFFYGLNIQIDLPTTNEMDCNISQYRSLENELYIGLPNQNLRADYGSVYKLVLNNKFSTIENLALWEKKHIVKIPQIKRDAIIKVIYADKETPMKEIVPILKYFKEKEEKNLFYAMRKKEMPNGLKICLKKADLNYPILEINGNEKIKEHLTKIEK